MALAVGFGLPLILSCGSDASSTASVQTEAAPSTGSEPTGTETPSSTVPAATSSAVSATEPLPSTDTRPSADATTVATPPRSDPPTPETTTPPASTGTTSVPFDGGLDQSPSDVGQVVRLRFDSRVGDVTSADLASEALAILNDSRGWPRAGFTFVADDASPFTVVLAEGAEVDELCLPLRTGGTVSCQNGPVVALNATRWRSAVNHWDGTVATYRGYLVNHEVGHLLGLRHPKPRCPVAGRPAGVMEQQTAGLEGCTGNPWPRDWEIALAEQRPVVYAPLPDWGPDPVPANGETP